MINTPFALAPKFSITSELHLQIGGAIHNYSAQYL